MGLERALLEERTVPHAALQSHWQRQAVIVSYMLPFYVLVEGKREREKEGERERGNERERVREREGERGRAQRIRKDQTTLLDVKISITCQSA